MKNILAENLLRFGVKNLSESDIKKIQEQADEVLGAGSKLAMNNLGLSFDKAEIDIANNKGFMGLTTFQKAFTNYLGVNGSNSIGKNLYIFKSSETIPQSNDPATQRLSPIAGVRFENIIKTFPIKGLIISTGPGQARAYFSSTTLTFPKTLLEQRIEAWKRDNGTAEFITGKELYSLFIGSNLTDKNEKPLATITAKNSSLGLEYNVRVGNQKIGLNWDSIKLHLQPIGNEGNYMFINLAANSPKNIVTPIYEYQTTDVGSGVKTIQVGIVPEIFSNTATLVGTMLGVSFT